MSNIDLDKGGRLPQNVKTFLGPSVGWKYTDSPVDIEFIINSPQPGYMGGLLIPDWLTINSWFLFGDVSGSAVVDLWKVTSDQYLAGTVPTVANTITGSALPTVAGAVAAEGGTLTGWTTQINQNDFLGFNVNSVSAFKILTIVVRCIRNIGPS